MSRLEPILDRRDSTDSDTAIIIFITEDGPGEYRVRFRHNHQAFSLACLHDLKTALWMGHQLKKMFLHAGVNAIVEEPE